MNDFDPNVSLQSMRAIVSEYLDDNYDGTDWAGRLEELAGLFHQMDLSLTRGEFLPGDWQDAEVDYSPHETAPWGVRS